MKACIVAYDEYINIPYVKDYESLLNANHIEYEFILWNRSGDTTANHTNNLAHVFNRHTGKSKISKLFPFLLWSKFARKVLKDNSYDFLIICTTIPAILLFDVLVKKYKKRFLLDIRDFTYENIRLYRFMEKRLIQVAWMTAVSSKGFLNWLPVNSNPYILTHNITNTKECCNVN